jgi:hypothetical protein
MVDPVEMPPQLVSCDFVVAPTTIPALETETEPYWFVTIMSAHAAIGNANANNANRNTRLI